jgi:hypothetical protein
MVRNVTDDDGMGSASDPYTQAHMKTNVAVVASKTVVALVATLLLMLPPLAGGAALAATATTTGLGSNCARPLFSSQIQHPNFTMQKEDSPSHQNVGTCMKY